MQSECVCAGLRMIMKSKEKKSKGLNGSSASGGKNGISWEDI